MLADPRWDRQVEARAGYYASLLFALGADLAPLAAFLAEHRARDESDVWLPIAVLSELAQRGAPGVGTAIAQTLGGPWWHACLSALVDDDALAGAVVPVAAVAALVRRLTTDELGRAVVELAAPWRAWANEVPALAVVLE